MNFENEVKHIAKLARIDLSAKETEQFSQDISDILNYMDVLNNYNIEDVEPLISPNEIHNVWRDDKKGSHLIYLDTFSNTNNVNNNFFQVQLLVKKS